MRQRVAFGIAQRADPQPAGRIAGAIIETEAGAVLVGDAERLQRAAFRIEHIQPIAQRDQESAAA